MASDRRSPVRSPGHRPSTHVATPVAERRVSPHPHVPSSMHASAVPAQATPTTAAASAHFINNVKSLYAGMHAFPEGLGAFPHLAMSPLTHPALAPHGLPTIPTASPLHHHPLHPVMMGAHREPYNFYPWLMGRPAGIHRYPGQYIITCLRSHCSVFLNQIISLSIYRLSLKSLLLFHFSLYILINNRIG